MIVLSSSPSSSPEGNLAATSKAMSMSMTWGRSVPVGYNCGEKLTKSSLPTYFLRRSLRSIEPYGVVVSCHVAAMMRTGQSDRKYSVLMSGLTTFNVSFQVSRVHQFVNVK